MTGRACLAIEGMVRVAVQNLGQRKIFEIVIQKWKIFIPIRPPPGDEASSIPWCKFHAHTFLLAQTPRYILKSAISIN